MFHPRALVLTLHSIRSLVHEKEPDPYVIIELRADQKRSSRASAVLEKFKSSIKKDAVLPTTFEETFVLCRKLGIAGPKIGALAKTLCVNVWEYNRFKDKMYGFFEIDLNQFRPAKTEANAASSKRAVAYNCIVGSVGQFLHASLPPKVSA